MLPSPSTVIKSSSDHRDAILSRAEIASRICQGALLIIYQSTVINATSWAPYHPGGALAIQHFVGRDATDEIEAYHSPATLERVKQYRIGRVDCIGVDGWNALTPPIALGLVPHPDGVKGHWAREGPVLLSLAVLGGRDQQATAVPEVVKLSPIQLEPPPSNLDRAQEHARSRAYRELRARIVAAGLFDRPGPLAGYGSDLIRYGLLGGAAFTLYFMTSGWVGQMVSAAILGMLFQQLAFLVHDAGHIGVTRDWWWDKVIGMTVASWCGGLSLGWWCDNHNVHHLVTNHPEHDPDIQHIPFFAISKQFFGSLWSTYYKRVMALDGFARVMLSVQHKLYYIVLSLARFNLYALSYSFLLGPKAKHDSFWCFEIAGIAFFWMYFGAMLYFQRTWPLRLGYLLVSHVFASPVHVQIVLSHFACSTDDLGPIESFPSRQLRTTMDVICSPEIEFLHGGLHLQVTHHLFPRLPRHNLRKASLLVKEYCLEQDIVYREHGFVDGNRQVLGVLQDVANQIQFIKTVADAEIDEKIR